METRPPMSAADRVRALPCWSGRVDPEPLAGGITNANFLVRDRTERYVVRIGDDIPLHGVLRFNELAASQAAFAAGLSPEIVHAAPGALVMRYIDGRPLTAADVRKPEVLARVVQLTRQCHEILPAHLRGPLLMFWVFHVLRDYAATLRGGQSRMMGQLPELQSIAAELEALVGPIQIVFGHNDLLPANILDDGTRLWLIDWDYAGWNSPLFDLANLCSNSEVAEASECAVLATYFGRDVAPHASDELWRRYCAMKCASLLREAMWSMVSELHSKLAFDYVAYTNDNLARFRRAYAALPRL